LPIAEPKTFASAPAPSYTAAAAPSKAPEINDNDEFDMSFFQKIADEG
jgi:hypothetical protein